MTAHPTAAWAAWQLTEAFPSDEPQQLIHDNDAIYGDVFTKTVEAMGIADRPTAYRAPWMNCYVECVIGSIRRDCTDHILVFNEKQLLARLQEYADYYNHQRCDLSLERNARMARTPA